MKLFRFIFFLIFVSSSNFSSAASPFDGDGILPIISSSSSDERNISFPIIDTLSRLIRRMHQQHITTRIEIGNAGAISMNEIYQRALIQGTGIDSEQSAMLAVKILSEEVNQAMENNFVIQALHFVPPFSEDRPGTTRFFDALGNHDFARQFGSRITAHSIFSHSVGPLCRLLFERLMFEMPQIQNGEAPMHHVRFFGLFRSHEVILVGNLNFQNSGSINLDQLGPNIVLFDPLHNEHYVGPQDVLNYLRDFRQFNQEIMAQSFLPQTILEIPHYAALLKAYRQDISEGDRELSRVKIFLAKKLLSTKKKMQQNLKDDTKRRLKHIVLLKEAERILSPNNENK